MEDEVSLIMTRLEKTIERILAARRQTKHAFLKNAGIHLNYLVKKNNGYFDSQIDTFIRFLNALEITPADFASLFEDEKTMYRKRDDFKCFTCSSLDSSLAIMRCAFKGEVFSRGIWVNDFEGVKESLEIKERKREMYLSSVAIVCEKTRCTFSSFFRELEHVSLSICEERKRDILKRYDLHRRTWCDVKKNSKGWKALIVSGSEKPEKKK